MLRGVAHVRVGILHVSACARAGPCVRSCMFLLWTCECECRTSAVLSGHRCSAKYATIVALLSSARFRLSVDDLQPAPAYTPANTSHAIRNRSPSTRAQRISTRAIEATQESVRYRSAADHRRQRICSQVAHTLDAKASWTFHEEVDLTGGHGRTAAGGRRKC